MTCWRCEGVGVVFMSKEVKCPMCKGKETIPVQGGVMACPTCTNGKVTRYERSECPECKGKG